MRIAFTGASSTGKTTLARALMETDAFRSLIPVFIPSEGKQVLGVLGFTGLDFMSQTDTALYELAYFAWKVGRETAVDAFLTDRSYVDVASYWIERDTIGRRPDVTHLLVEPCRKLSAKYDLHVYFPDGQIAFEEDGLRSTDRDQQRRVGDTIRRLLDEWELDYVEINEPQIEARVELVLNEVVRRASTGGELASGNTSVR